MIHICRKRQVGSGISGAQNPKCLLRSHCITSGLVEWRLCRKTQPRLHRNGTPLRASFLFAERNSVISCCGRIRAVRPLPPFRPRHDLPAAGPRPVLPPPQPSPPCTGGPSVPAPFGGPFSPSPAAATRAGFRASGRRPESGMRGKGAAKTAVSLILFKRRQAIRSGRGAPSAKAVRLASARSAMAVRTSSAAVPRWGSSTTLSIARRSGGISGSWA